MSENVAKLNEALDRLPYDQSRAVSSVLLGMLAAATPAKDFDRMLPRAVELAKQVTA